MDRYLSVDTVAERLALSRSTIYRLIRRKALRTVRIGGRQRIPESAIEQMVREQKEDSPTDGRQDRRRHLRRGDLDL